MIVIISEQEKDAQQLKNCFTALNQPVVISCDPLVIEQASLLVLPNEERTFEQAMKALSVKKLDILIRNHVKKGKFLLAIGSSFHLLYEGLASPTFVSGLNLLEGLSEWLPDDSDYPLPHNGFACLIGLAEDSLLTKGLTGAEVYYNHSLTVDCELEQIKALSQYSLKFPAIVEQDRIIGLQFLPELSSETGLQVLSNIIDVLTN